MEQYKNCKWYAAMMFVLFVLGLGIFLFYAGFYLGHQIGCTRHIREHLRAHRERGDQDSVPIYRFKAQ